MTERQIKLAASLAASALQKQMGVIEGEAGHEGQINQSYDVYWQTWKGSVATIIAESIAPVACQPTITELLLLHEIQHEYGHVAPWHLDVLSRGPAPEGLDDLVMRLHEIEAMGSVADGQTTRTG